MGLLMLVAVFQLSIVIKQDPCNAHRLIINACAAQSVVSIVAQLMGLFASTSIFTTALLNQRGWP